MSFVRVCIKCKAKEERRRAKINRNFMGSTLELILLVILSE